MLKAVGYIFLGIFILTSFKANPCAYALGLKRIESPEDFKKFAFWNSIHVGAALIAFTLIMPSD